MKRIAIGEDMENRVIPWAEQLQAEYYVPPPLDQSLSTEQQLNKALEKNGEWINEKMDQGYEVIDCGPAPGRANYPAPTSDFYAMELEEIAKRDYGDYHRIESAEDRANPSAPSLESELQLEESVTTTSVENVSASNSATVDDPSMPLADAVVESEKRGSSEAEIASKPESPLTLQPAEDGTNFSDDDKFWTEFDSTAQNEAASNRQAEILREQTQKEAEGLGH